ncbi:MAG: glycosyltransferase family 4 protein, partial [Cyclobacteriaceae bacterium]|nr:glycosyltransferase family 4 protein [Cyclobacteriaceae bacterium]
MKIAYDAKRLFNNDTGLGNYSRTLAGNIAHVYPENSYYLYTPAIKRKAGLDMFFKPPFHVRRPSEFSIKSYWRSRGVVNDIINDKIDIYHGLSHEIPFGLDKTKVKTVVTIHDLIYKLYPNQYTRVDRYIYDRKIKYGIEHADLIIAASESTKADLIREYNADPNKTEVLYQGIDPIFYKTYSKDEIDEIGNTNHLPAQYILYVGSVIERKKLLTLLRAFERIKGLTKHHLLVVGHGRAYKEKAVAFVNRHGLEDRVKFCSDVNFNDLPVIYKKADAFVYPSEYEGFGIPILEAISQGTPVITGNKSSLPEVGGKAALYCDPEDDK